MYAVMNFGVFVCSTCAGTHREINNKVKGLSMCTFSEAELKNLAQNGNLVSKLHDDSTYLVVVDLTKYFIGKMET
jgi:hypothetical protein